MDAERRGIDLKSIIGKRAPPAEHAEMLIVGAGPAGLAAAIEGAKAGANVVLIDENPVAAALMGLDVPLYYGQRMDAAVQNQGRMIERIAAASPGFEEAIERGVDIRLGVSAWGAFVASSVAPSFPGPVLGLADAGRSWLCGFDRLIVAAGARDLVLFFEGSDQPGVMGANALHALLMRYDSFSGRRILVLGSGPLALKTAERALARGLEIAALVEIRDAPQGSPDQIARLESQGVPILCGHTILKAERGPYGVAGAILTPDLHIACDTICLAIGLTPNVELFDCLGAEIAMRPERGGFVPVLHGGGATSIQNVFAAGDCAGLLADPDHPRDWMRALLKTGGFSVPACQCEDVSRADLLDVQPPNYLGPRPPAMANRTLATLAADGPINPDQIKRLTRAGMGPCQGRRCREQIALLLSLTTDAPLSNIPLAGYRAPVRPLPLSLLAADDETQAMRDHWDVWFGIPTQWVPHDDIGTDREAAWLGTHL